ncbi:MAG: PAS domain S-box protein, partial [Candidatus Binatia bacterium]
MIALPKVYFERLLEISPDIVIAVDREGKIVFYNDGAERTLGYASEELLGEHVVGKVYPDAETARAIMKAMRDPATDVPDAVKNFETVVVDRSGERIPIAISGTIIRDHDDLEVGSIGFAKDLREIRRRDQLATMGELAVSLAHEINNPLEAIGNNLDLVSKFLVSHSTDEEYVVEGERLEAIQRELEIGAIPRWLLQQAEARVEVDEERPIARAEDAVEELLRGQPGLGPQRPH